MNYGEIIKKRINDVDGVGFLNIPDESFRMSLIGSSCNRQMQLRHRPSCYFSGEIVRRIADTKKLWDSGISPMTINSLVREYIQEIVEDETPEGVVLIEKMPDGVARIDEKGVKIVGHYDLLVKVWGVMVICDVKTVTSHEKKHLPYKGDIDQIMLYMGALNLNNGVVIYVMKDSGETFAVDVTFNKDRYDHLIDRFVFIQRVEEDGILLPTVKSDENGYPCSYCEWNTVCFSEKDAGR